MGRGAQKINTTVEHRRHTQPDLTGKQIIAVETETLQVEGGSVTGLRAIKLDDGSTLNLRVRRQPTGRSTRDPDVSYVEAHLS